MRLPIRSFVFISLSLCLMVAAVSAAASSAGISSAAADTSGIPPQEVSAYISEAKTAMAESDWTSVLLITTRGLAWYPDNADLLCIQAYSYRRTGQYQKSIDAVSKAIAIEGTAVRYANRGYGYLALGNYSAALADAGAGISLDGNYTSNYAVMALAANGLGQNTEALKAIDTALTQSPDSAHYWHVKGMVLAAGGDCSGAQAALEKSIAIDSGYVLPWPGFGAAEEELAAVKTDCVPAPAGTPTAKSPLMWAAIAGIAGAVIAAGLKR